MIRAFLSRLRRALARDRLPPRPHRQRARRLTVAEADRILLALPALERAVYLNHRKLGLSYATIARRLDLTSHEVEAIMTRVYFRLVCSVRDIEHQRDR